MIIGMIMGNTHIEPHQKYSGIGFLLSGRS